MKYEYKSDKKIRVIFPFDEVINKGHIIEATDKDTQKRLKELGFKEVTKKEGDE